jgi:hypothetical protein
MGDLYVVKVDNGYARLYKQDGTFVRHICRDAVSAKISGDEVHVTVKDAIVKIFSVKGFYIKTVGKYAPSKK